MFRLGGKYVAEQVVIFRFSLFSSPLIKTLFSACYAAGRYFTDYNAFIFIEFQKKIN